MNGPYKLGLQKILEGEINWLSQDFKFVLLSDAYEADLDEHEFLSDIPVDARIAISDSLTSKTSTNGVADADNITLSAVNGNDVVAFVLIRDTGDATTSPLLVYWDTATNLPLELNGGSVELTFSSDSSRIFSLS